MSTKYGTPGWNEPEGDEDDNFAIEDGFESAAEALALDDCAALYDEREDAEDLDDHDTDVGAPCPACFESSGFYARNVPDTWTEPGWAEPDPNRPCDYCCGTGTVSSDPLVIDDTEFRNDDFIEDGYLTLVDNQGRETLYIEDGILEPA
jgi:hypothetical protein